MYQQYLYQAQASLMNMDSNELKELLNDDAKLDERVIESTNSLETAKDTIMKENRQLAEDNLLKEPVLIELNGRINELATEAKTICDSVQEKLNEIKSKSNTMNPETALALLQTAAAESEEESDIIFKQLMDSEIQIEVFIDQFMAMRKTMHLRKIKSEKMTELLRQPRITPNPGSSFYPPTSMGGNMPYPMGNIGMPMPGMFRPY